MTSDAIANSPRRAPAGNGRLRLLVGGLVALAVAVCLKPAWTRFESRGRDLIDPIVERQTEHLPVRFSLIHAPTFLSGAVLDGIALAACKEFTQSPEGLKRVCDPLDGQLLTDIARYYADNRDQGSNAWIKRVVSVQRIKTPAEQRIEIVAEYRVPYALINFGDSYYLVDHEGVRLAGPFDENTRKGFPFFLVIRNVDEPLRKAGEAFVSPEMQAAVELADVLYAQPFAKQLQAINVANFNGRLDGMAPQMTIETAYNTSIWWGRPVHDEKFFEVPLKDKLAALSGLCARYNRVDANQPPGGYVDIRFEEIQTRKPGEDPSTALAHDAAG